MLTYVGWQVTLCDPIWQVTPCSSSLKDEMLSRTLFHFNFNFKEVKRQGPEDNKELIQETSKRITEIRQKIVIKEMMN